MSGPFEQASAQDIRDLMAAHPLAWLVSQGDQGFCGTPIPLLEDPVSDGPVVSLLGHMARRNRHVDALTKEPRALVIFQGPHGYISPSWMADRTQAPTWNYTAVRMQVEVRFDEAETDLALAKLVAAMEKGRERAWSEGEMGVRYSALAQHVIAFRARVVSIEPRFKLGQDERDDVFVDILNGLGDTALSAWMRRFNLGRG